MNASVNANLKQKNISKNYSLVPQLSKFTCSSMTTFPNKKGNKLNQHKFSGKNIC